VDPEYTYLPHNDALFFSGVRGLNPRGGCFTDVISGVVGVDGEVLHIIEARGMYVECLASKVKILSPSASLGRRINYLTLAPVCAVLLEGSAQVV
jgi:hypothetical protein